tara:strand:- start:2682 stop:3650 length:969 start_codon:yes stop_codon:yes gene_type:complete
MNEAIEFWINHNFKNWSKNNNVEDLNFSVIMMWLKSEDSARHRKRIDRLSVRDAMHLSNKWLNKKNEIDILKDDSSFTDTVMVFKKGFKIVKINNPLAYKREGLLMKHCLKDDFITMSLSSSIYSLRDEKNNPHCTIEICKKRREVRQIKGKMNRPLSDFHSYFIKKFLVSLDGYRLSSDFDKINWFPTDYGYKTFNQLPDSFSIYTSIKLNKIKGDIENKINIIGSFSIKESNCQKIKNLNISEEMNIEDMDSLKEVKNIFVRDQLTIKNCPNLSILNNVSSNVIKIINCPSIDLENIRDKLPVKKISFLDENFIICNMHE